MTTFPLAPVHSASKCVLIPCRTTNLLAPTGLSPIALTAAIAYRALFIAALEALPVFSFPVSHQVLNKRSTALPSLWPAPAALRESGTGDRFAAAGLLQPAAASRENGTPSITISLIQVVTPMVDMSALVELCALETCGNAVAGLSRTSPGLDVALSAASAQSHTSFCWSVASLRSASSGAAALISSTRELISSAWATTDGRRRLLAALEECPHRPVQLDARKLQIGSKQASTACPLTAIAIWDTLHPAGVFMSSLHAGATEPQQWLSTTFSPERFSSRASVVLAACGTLSAQLAPDVSEQ